MRVILYTGKGGVGKTSVAAATALRPAELGYKTIAISTDAAHSLADSLDIPLGPEATPIAPNLWGQETDMGHTIEKYWGAIGDWLKALMAWRGIDEVHFHYTPTHASWLNQVEVWFSILTRQALRGLNANSPNDLRRAIDNFTDSRNDHPVPFDWTKSVAHPVGLKHHYADLYK